MGNNISNWARDHSHILAKNITAFCPCLKNLLEAKLKSFGLISLTEILRQTNIDSATWLLVITLMQACNENEQAVEKEI